MFSNPRNAPTPQLSPPCWQWTHDLLLFHFTYLALTGLWDHIPCTEKGGDMSWVTIFILLLMTQIFLSLTDWSPVKGISYTELLSHPLIFLHPLVFLSICWDFGMIFSFCSLPELKHRWRSQGSEYENLTLLLIVLNWRTLFEWVAKWASQYLHLHLSLTLSKTADLKEIMDEEFIASLWEREELQVSLLLAHGALLQWPTTAPLWPI